MDHLGIELTEDSGIFTSPLASAVFIRRGTELFVFGHNNYGELGLNIEDNDYISTPMKINT
jgi:hypothetical protein